MNSESKKSISTGEDSKSDDQDKQLMDLTNLRLTDYKQTQSADCKNSVAVIDGALK
jgi:hypothetical protein